MIKHRGPAPQILCRLLPTPLYALRGTCLLMFSSCSCAKIFFDCLNRTYRIANTIFYGWLIYMYEKIMELVKAHQNKLTDDELQSIAFFCECLVQERELTRHRNYNDELLRYFYTGR